MQLVGDDLQSPVKLGSQITHDYKNVDELSRAMLVDCQQADARWKRLEEIGAEARKLVAADRLLFFQANVTTQTGIHLHSNRMLEEIAKAALKSSNDDKLSAVKAAIREGQAIEAALEAADYGKWHGFYTDGDWLLDIPRTLALAQAYEDKLEGRRIPENAIIRARDGGFAYWMVTAYQGTQEVQF